MLPLPCAKGRDSAMFTLRPIKSSYQWQGGGLKGMDESGSGQR
jgi:hypothetical protein